MLSQNVYPATTIMSKFPKQRLKNMAVLVNYIAILLSLVCGLTGPLHSQTIDRTTALDNGLEFIDTSFENASPLHWDIDDAGHINVSLMYDHERNTLNRAAGHWHFRIHAKKGTHQTIIFNNLINITLLE